MKAMIRHGSLWLQVQLAEEVIGDVLTQLCRCNVAWPSLFTDTQKAAPLLWGVDIVEPSPIPWPGH